jgi:cytochrome c-type protein NapB
MMPNPSCSGCSGYLLQNLGEIRKSMIEKTDRGIGKALDTFAWVLLIFIGFTVFSALTNELNDSEAASPATVSQRSDQSGAATFRNYDSASTNHIEDGSTGRTLSQYYSRRQYPGSPPEIPHPVEVHGKELECLKCHADGGWTIILKRMTPVTPHPELISCNQCHVWPVTGTLFRANGWQSVPPPRLGRSYLPGAPPAIPHDLQMRENCHACHVGPGTVVEIRMKHNWRGICRQCHVPDRPVEPFRR